MDLIPMKNQDSTKKHVKTLTDSQAAIAPEARNETAGVRELTDAELAAVVGGDAPLNPQPIPPGRHPNE